jgi:hypothetical protein
VSELTGIDGPAGLVARSATTRPAGGALVALVVVALAGAGFGWFYYGRGLEVPDEGLLLHVAERLAAGEVPYRDVYFIYTPGLQYALALLFRLLGPSLAIEHALQLGLHLALVATVYALALRLARWTPLAVAAALAAVAGGLNSYRFCLGLFAVLLLTRYAESGRRRWLLATGLAVGTTYLFAQEVGLYALGAGLGYLGLEWLASGSLRERLGGLCADTALLGLGAGLVLGPWLLVLTSQMALLPMLDATLRVAFLHQPRYMHVPLPALLPIVPADLDTNVVWGPPSYLLYVKGLLYLPFVLVATGWTLAVADCWRGAGREPAGADEPRPARQAAWPLLCFATLALATVADRADYYHLRQVLPVSLVLIAWLLARCRAGLGRGRAVGAVALLPFLPLILVGLGEAAAFRAEQATPLVTARGTVLVDETKAQDLGRLLAALAERTAPGEAIYVWPAETGVYFLADRPNPSRYGQLVPTELEILAEDDARAQRAIVRAIADAGVRWAVAAPTENVDGLPFAVYAPLLAAYLEDNYLPVGRFGYWTLRQRTPPAPR